jgi:hypothetical protein
MGGPRIPDRMARQERRQRKAAGTAGGRLGRVTCQDDAHNTPALRSGCCLLAVTAAAPLAFSGMAVIWDVVPESHRRPGWQAHPVRSALRPGAEGGSGS